ncbi:hypothetical protein F4802DRAFT_611494 [Xylaria palmicola]|nr:hypothetical protein F4802DRAFT_611494 [Xylaria palmicola]
MAVIKGLPGLEATVVIAGKSLPEYDDPHEAPHDDEDVQAVAIVSKASSSVVLQARQIPHVIKYIEATPGKEFKVHFVRERCFQRSSHHIGVTLELDGQATVVHHEPSYSRKLGWETYINVIKNYTPGIGWRHQVPSDQCDEEMVNEHVANSKYLGTIRVLVYKMLASPSEARSSPLLFTPRDHIAEKALGGRVLHVSVGFGWEVLAHAPVDYKDCYQDPGKQPCAIFEFRYRTRVGLTKELILPPPNPIDFMTDSEVREYAKKAYYKKQDCINRKEGSNSIEVKKAAATASSTKRRLANADVPQSKRHEVIKQEDAIVIDTSDEDTKRGGGAESPFAWD